MKKLTLAIAAAAFVASPVFAAEDMKAKDMKKDENCPAPTHHKHHAKHHKHHEAPMECPKMGNNFDGPYLGLELGMGANLGKNSASVTSAGVTDLADLSGRGGQAGILGGLNAGWNWTMPRHSEAHWLVGVDLFADAANLHNSNSGATSQGTVITSGSISQKTNMKWGFGAGLKLGAIVKNVLLFTTVHWVGSEFHLKGTFADNNGGGAAVIGATAKHKKFLSGVRAGLGFEMPISHHLKFGMNTGYSWYKAIKASNGVTTNATGLAFVPATTASFKNTPNVWDAKLTLAWAFKGN